MRIRANREHLATDIYRAQTFLLARRRLFTSGVREKTRLANRASLRRGPGVLKQDNKALPFLRYVHGADIPLDKFSLVAGHDSWFWEVGARTTALDDGRAEGMLTVTGLSRVSDVLSYGPELLRLMNTAAWFALSRDANAEIETTYLVI